MKSTFVASLFFILLSVTIADAQETIIKDSVRYYAFNAPNDWAQSIPRSGRDSSFIANFELNFWKHNDTTQIKKLIAEQNRLENEMMQNGKSGKDTARLKALRARMDVLKSAYANAKSGWKDSAKINDLKAKIANQSKNSKRIIVKKESMGEDISRMQDGLTSLYYNMFFKDSTLQKALKSQLNIFFKDSALHKALQSQIELTNSFAKNLQLGIMDSTRVKELKELGKVNSDMYLSKLRTAGLMGNSQEGADLSQLSLKKSFKGESIETVKKFSVTENSKMLKIDLVGRAESGSIMITITKPDGSKFKSIDIDSSSDVNFEQTLQLKKSSADWIGDWQIKVKTRKANGDYRLNIVTR